MNTTIATLILLASAILATSCDKDSTPEIDLTEYHAKKEAYHGKYKILSATGNKPADINGDGTASLNLLSEVDRLPESEIVIRVVYDTTAPSKSYYALFEQLWPEQYLSLNGKKQEGLIPVNPNVQVLYALQGVMTQCTIDDADRQIVVEPEAGTASTPYQWTIPGSVTIIGDDELQVVTTRQFYTKTGWVELVVTTTYERYIDET